jgi:hypothetical protein
LVSVFDDILVSAIFYRYQYWPISLSKCLFLLSLKVSKKFFVPKILKKEINCYLTLIFSLNIFISKMIKTHIDFEFCDTFCLCLKQIVKHNLNIKNYHLLVLVSLTVGVCKEILVVLVLTKFRFWSFITRK